MPDPLLVPFAGAGDEAAADRALEDLLQQHVLPLVRTIATRKLRVYGGTGFRAEDVEDVVGDATLVLVDRLLELRRSPGAAPIESLADYTATVAYNVCAHQIRRRNPGRARLKNRLRYVLAHRDALAVWDTAGTGAVCGLAGWRGNEPDAAAMEALAALEHAPERAPDFDSSVTRSAEALARRVEALLRTLGGPVELDALVGIVARLCRIDAPRPVPLTDRVAVQPSRDDAIDRRRDVERVWLEIVALPVRQRLAMLLSLRDGNGASLLWIFPLLGIASIRRIAQVLGWLDAELAEVWPRLPLDDNAIAARLACTRQQVINLRQSARKRLANRREGAHASGARSDERVNLAPVSSSLESDA